MPVLARRLSIICLTSLVFALSLQTMVQQFSRRPHLALADSPLCASTLLSACSTAN